MILFLLYITEAFFLYFLLYIYTKDLLNPFGISIFMWLLGAAISQLNVGVALTTWSILMHITVQVFVLSVLIIGVSCKPLNIGKWYYSKCIGKIDNRFTKASRLLIFISIICSIIEWRANNFIVVLGSGLGADVKDTMIALSGIHYGTVCLPYSGLIALHELYFKINKKRRTWIFNILVLSYSVFEVVFIEASRGSLIIIIFGAILLTHSRFKINFAKLGKYAVLIIGLMVIIMWFRVTNKESLIYTATGTYRWWTPIYMYIATCYDNLNSLVTNGSPFTIAYMSIIKPVFEVFNIDAGIDVVQYEYMFFNAKTMAYGFYHDMSILGVFFYTFIIYFVVGIIYKKARFDSRYVLLLAALQKSIYMVFFGNYFTGTFITSFPFIAIALLIFSSRGKTVHMDRGRTYETE